MLTDAELRELLLVIDQDDDYKVELWEAEFLERVLYLDPDGPISMKDRGSAYLVRRRWRKQKGLI